MIKNNDILYKVIFDINTDGDWTYNGIDIKEQYCMTPEIALNKIIERMELMHNTIEYDNSNILNELKLLISDNIEYAKHCLKQNDDIENYNDCFEYSNWDGVFEIEKVKVEIDENGILSIIEFKENKNI